MAIKGLSIPVCGEYSNNEGAVSYANPFIANKAVEYSISWETGDDNPDYQDNMIAENDKGTFQSGELSLTIGDLPQELLAKLLGVGTSTDTVDGESVTVANYDDEMNPPFLGFGIIELHQINDVNKYRAVFLHKVNFQLPEESATTLGESIDWQHKELTGTIRRSDATSPQVHPWLSEAWFETEAQALAWLQYRCGGTTPSA